MLTEQLNIFVFGLLAPYVLPIISQVKTELNTGSSEIIQSSKDKQHIVFHDDDSTDPTHSMLSKDHFSNVLNEPAGKIAAQVLKWVVPQLIACWDDEQINVDRTLTRIINGVFNHPALRDHGDDGAADGRRLMFGVVEQWWAEKGEHEREILRDQLSRDGVEKGRNHKAGVHDKGHGCGKPLGMPTYKTAGSSGAVGGPAAEAILGGMTSPGGNAGSAEAGRLAGEALGGGALGGIVGGIVGGLGGDLLGQAFSGSDTKKQTYQNERYEADGSYTQSVTQTGYNQSRHGGGGQQRYGQAEYTRTDVSGGGRREEYQRYEQGGGHDGSGYGQRVTQESRPTYGGGYEKTTETRYERSGGEWHSEVRREGRDARGQSYEESERYEGGSHHKKESDSDGDKKGKKHKKKHHKNDKHDSDSDNDKYKGYGERQRGYNTEERSSRERRGYGEDRPGYGEGHDSRQGGREYGSHYKKESDSDENKDGKKHKKKHRKHEKHDSDSGDDNHKAYGERQRGYDPEERSARERQGYGKSRPEYGEGYDSRQGGRDYRNESRDDDSRPAYDRYGSERQDYDRGERGYGRQRGEHGQRDQYEREERTDPYGEDRGYGHDNEDEERRGNRYGYGRRDDY